MRVIKDLCIAAGASLAVFSGCSAQRGDDSPSAEAPLVQAAAASGFVTAGKDGAGRPRFFVDGRPFRFVGANANEIPYIALGDADSELAYAQQLGLKVIRVWGVDDGLDADQMAGTLRPFLDKAAARGLFVTIALTHNYRQADWVRGGATIHAVPNDAHPNGFVPDRSAPDPNEQANGFYSRACGGGLWCLNDKWLDWGYTAYYKPYALRLVSLLADHKAIFSWDIANEVTGSSADRWIVQRVTSFYVTMAAAIKQADPNHMVTTGMISTSWAAMQDSDRDAIYKSPNVDYLTIHEYDIPGGDQFNLSHQDDEVWRANVRYGKPVVVEEVGVHRDDVGAEEQALSSYTTRRLSPADKSFEVTGIMQFGFCSPARPFVGDGVWGNQADFTWFASFWQGWSNKLAGEYGSSGGGGGSSGGYAAGVFRDTSTQRTLHGQYPNGDWDSCHGKMDCANGETLAGISQTTNTGAGNAALCRAGSSFSGTINAFLNLDASVDQRRATRGVAGFSGTDWAPGSYKLECGSGEYVASVSEDAMGCQGDNHFHGVLCGRGPSGLGSACNVRRLGIHADDRGTTASGDWNAGAYKAECAGNEYVAGVSVDPQSRNLTSVLCCAQ